MVFFFKKKGKGQNIFLKIRCKFTKCCCSGIIFKNVKNAKKGCFFRDCVKDSKNI